MSNHQKLVMLVIIGVLILCELLLFNVLLPLLKALRRRNSPVHTVRALVLLAENRTAALLPWWMRIPFGSRRGVPDGQLEDWGDQHTYWITFEIGHSRLEFEVDEAQFSNFEPDDLGELTYQADKVLSFIREKKNDEEETEHVKTYEI